MGIYSTFYLVQFVYAGPHIIQLYVSHHFNYCAYNFSLQFKNIRTHKHTTMPFIQVQTYKRLCLLFSHRIARARTVFVCLSIENIQILDRYSPLYRHTHIHICCICNCDMVYLPHCMCVCVCVPYTRCFCYYI